MSTFLSQLKAAREAADTKPSDFPSELYKLLVNNAEKLERLIEAAGEVDRQMLAASEGYPDTGGIRGLKKALAALEWSD